MDTVNLGPAAKMQRLIHEFLDNARAELLKSQDMEERMIALAVGPFLPKLYRLLDDRLDDESARALLVKVREIIAEVES